MRGVYNHTELPPIFSPSCLGGHARLTLSSCFFFVVVVGRLTINLITPASLGLLPTWKWELLVSGILIEKWNLRWIPVKGSGKDIPGFRPARDWAWEWCWWWDNEWAMRPPVWAREEGFCRESKRANTEERWCAPPQVLSLNFDLWFCEHSRQRELPWSFWMGVHGKAML